MSCWLSVKMRTSDLVLVSEKHHKNHPPNSSHPNIKCRWWRSTGPFNSLCATPGEQNEMWTDVHLFYTRKKLPGVEEEERSCSIIFTNRNYAHRTAQKWSEGFKLSHNVTVRHQNPLSPPFLKSVWWLLIADVWTKRGYDYNTQP